MMINDNFIGIFPVFFFTITNFCSSTSNILFEAFIFFSQMVIFGIGFTILYSKGRIAREILDIKAKTVGILAGTTIIYKNTRGTGGSGGSGDSGDSGTDPDENKDKDKNNENDKN